MARVLKNSLLIATFRSSCQGRVILLIGSGRENGWHRLASADTAAAAAALRLMKGKINFSLKLLSRRRRNFIIRPAGMGRPSFRLDARAAHLATEEFLGAFEIPGAFAPACRPV